MHIKQLLEKDLGLKDDRKGRNQYHKRLLMKSDISKAELSKMRKDFTRGWCIGSKQFKESIADEFMGRSGIVHCEGKELRELNEEVWNRLLKKSLNLLKIKSGELDLMKKTDDRKVVVAACLKEKTSASNQWIADKLKMGHPSTMSSIVSAARKSPSRTQMKMTNKLKTLKYAG